MTPRYCRRKMGKTKGYEDKSSGKESQIHKKNASKTYR